MPRSRITPGTPLIAAFLFCGLSVTGCRDTGRLAEMGTDACDMSTTPIASIQGDGYQSPMQDAQVTIRGLAIHVEPDTGVYVEEPGSDDDARTSNGLFIQDAELASKVRAGDRLSVAGTVTETGEAKDTITSLAHISGYRICASGLPLPETRESLPMGNREREALEAMRVSFRQELYVSDPWAASRGELTLSANAVHTAPTEFTRPGADAREKADENRRAVLRIRLAENDDRLQPAGTGVLSLAGVMGHDGKGQRLIASAPLHTTARPVFRVPAPRERDIRLLSLNLHNYFNGDGRGEGFPTERGAETAAQFASQRARLSATVEHIQPHVVAVMELENDGFGPHSAAEDFIEDLVNATGAGWRAARPGFDSIGGDVIRVGIFYREDRLLAVGDAEVLEGRDFEELSRVPMAQVFRDKISGEPFLLVVNHLKSKGSCPESGPNANRGDGQGCWNPARTSAAKVMANWSRQLADRHSRGRALVVGDMNAYHMEDPITAILDAGFLDLNPLEPVQPEFTALFYGQAGTLDYAFATPELRRFVQSSMVPNFNSIYPRDMELPLPWLGASDHDPVIVDFRLSQ